jgi:spore germination protein YaaH
MTKKLLSIFSGLFIGVIIGYIFVFYAAAMIKDERGLPILENPLSQKQVIGFLPYWLLSKAQNDYRSSISTLTYFGLTIDTDGKLLKRTSEQESEPGWYALKSGKADSFLNQAKKNNQKRSLLVFNGGESAISTLMEHPIEHARNLITDVKPLMQQYGFSDLNLDIESVTTASDEARLRFTQFIKEVKQGIDKNQLGTLTVEISGDSLIRKRLIDLAAINPYVDYVVIMAYDFHYIGSLVSGAVAPLSGAGTISEYDTQTAIQTALTYVPAKKVILGIPVYGYEWETLRESPRSATIPSSGLTASTQRIESLLNSCATCSAQFDNESKENYLIFKDSTGSYHQLFYPDANSTTAKIDFAKKESLGGIALWALGYENSTILEPLATYK